MKKFLLLCFSFVFAFSVWAQDRVVSGKITSSEDGSALPGVNVIQKGTSNGTVTGTDGAFRLSIPGTAPATLVFSFVGLTTQEVEVGDRTIVDVSMASDVTQLSEVFVTAQGIEKSKNELPYAAQKLSGDQLTIARDNNFVNSMSGKIAGVQVTKNNSMGGSTNIVIRGYKSITGSNQPLFVVDGVPVDNSTNNTNNGTAGQAQGTGGYDYGNAAADINGDDIESTTVLKGAAATALYGARGANGVVFITTKKARKAGLGVTINTGVTMGQVDKSTLPEYQHSYGAGYGQYYGPGGDAYFDQGDANGDGIATDLIVPTYEDATMGGKFDNSLVYQWDAFDKTSANYQKATPWKAGANDPNTFFKTAVSTSNNVSIDGGTDKSQFKLNYTHTTDNGIMPNSELKKDLANFSATFNLMPKLRVGAQINFSNINGKGRYGTGYDGANGRNIMTNTRQWWQMNLDMNELHQAYDRQSAYYGVPTNATWNYSGPPANLKPIFWDNPYWVRYQNFETDSRFRYFGNIRADYDVTDWLNVMGRVSLDSYDEQVEERIAQGSVGVSAYNRTMRTYREHNYDVMVNFKKDLSESLNLRATLGWNTRRTKVQSTYMTTNGGLVVPFLYAINNSVSPPAPPLEGFSDIAYDGYYANASLGVKKFLHVDLSYRWDVASTLPKANNAYGYYSAATSFVFSELIGVTPWLSVGKIRANYAEVGNGAAFNSLLDLYDKPVAWGSVTMFSIPGTKNNDQLKPERTKAYEVGLEMAFFDSRVGFDATYYNARTVDQVIPISISTATGYNSKFINAGEVENAGIELTMFGVPVKTPDFQWRIDVNWTRNRNKVVSIYTDAAGNPLQNILLGSYQGGVTTNAALGQPYGTLRGKTFVYNTNGEKLVTAGGYYQVTTTSNNILGDINPNWVGGINNSFSYKNIGLSFLIDIKNGGSMFSTDMYYGLATGVLAETAGLNELGFEKRAPVAEGGGILLPGVTSAGAPNTTRIEGDYFAQGYTNTPNKAFTYDASYVKLREIAITYSLPASIISKLGPFRGIDISAIGRNLWIISKNTPYTDPEDSFTAGNIQGVQIGALPNVKTYGFNLKMKF